jgi:hypothetical protein
MGPATKKWRNEQPAAILPVVGDFGDPKEKGREMVVMSDAARKTADSAPGARPVRTFCTVPEIKQSIRLSKYYSRDGSEPDEAETLLIYQTSLQQTLLVKTANRLYGILDDVRKPEPHVNWSIPMSDVVDENGGVKLPINAPDRVTRYQTSGKLDFGPNHRSWLFSTKLFTIESVKEVIKAFLRK